MHLKFEHFSLPFTVHVCVFQVPEIISTLRQAGKSSARNDETFTIPNKTLADPGDPKPLETHVTFSSLPAAGSAANNPTLSPTTFAKRFEVLFCGRVTVAHKKAPPALIDECIEKFSQLAQGPGTTKKGVNAGGLVGGLKRALAFQSNGPGSPTLGNGATGSPANGKRPLLFKRDPSFPSLQALDENGLSPEISHAKTTDALTHSPGVQPTSLQENRTMLFTVRLRPEEYPIMSLSRTRTSKYDMKSGFIVGPDE